jgi:Ser-Thr-rich glycosyl-phosphatidyl-inositol-anchored membrane family
MFHCCTDIQTHHRFQGAYKTNPVSAPSPKQWPTIGKPYTVRWNPAGQGPTVTLSLYTGCPHNCKELTDIAGGIKNTGSFTWTPSTKLQAGNGYGILFINEKPCMTSWTYFGLVAAGSGNTPPKPASPAPPAPPAPPAAVSVAKPSVHFRTTTTTLMETLTSYYDPATVIPTVAAVNTKPAGKTLTSFVTEYVTVTLQ